MAGIAQLKARVDDALQRITQQTEARDAFDQKLLALIDVMERGLSRKQAQIEEQRTSLEALQAARSETDAEREGLRRENADLRAKADSLETELTALKDGAAERESQAADLADLLDKLLTALDQQGESRLLSALDELRRRADHFDVDTEALSEAVADNPPAAATPPVPAPPAVPAAEASEAEVPEAPCSPEMAAVIESHDKQQAVLEAQPKAEASEEPEAQPAAADTPDVIAALDEAFEETPEIAAEADEPAEESAEIAAEANEATAPEAQDEAGDELLELVEPAAAPPPITAEAEAPQAETPQAETPGAEAAQPETDQSDTPGGELTLEAIGELLKERDDARQAKEGDQPESVRKIIERVNALADEMADPSHRGQPAAAAPTAEAKPDTETAEDLDEAAPAKAATGA